MSHSHHHHGLSRRDFLGKGACAALSSLPLFSTLLNLRLTSSLMAATPTSDYKALVCIFLFGGNDSFNMLVPRTRGLASDPGTYDEYAAIRADLSLAHSQLVALNEIGGSTQGGRLYGVHPGMPEVAQLFNAGHLAFVSNVGSLVRPTNKADYLSKFRLPVGLFSHSDQQEQWQTAQADTRSAIGWAGRAADIITASTAPVYNAPSPVSMNISIAGTNIFQAGRDVFSYSVTSTGAVALNGYAPTATSGLNVLRTAAVDSMLEQVYHNVLEDTFRGNVRSALDGQKAFQEAVNASPLLTTWPSGGGSLANQLKLVARVIGSQSTVKGLGAKRQTFFVGLGGWDHHDETLTSQAAMLPQVSKALKGFWDELVAMGAQNNVTTFQASDFGRTLSSNGQGSDHAWGGNYMLMGGAVRGGRIHGAYPELYAGNARDVGRGRIIPTLSVDEVSRDLLRWFGLDESQVALALPNIREFRASNAPLVGLMK